MLFNNKGHRYIKNKATRRGRIRSKMAQIIDACGRSFRELVLMTKKALESKQDRYKILVDNNTARQNVTRFANSAGYEVQVTEEADLFRLALTKKYRDKGAWSTYQPFSHFGAIQFARQLKREGIPHHMMPVPRLEFFLRKLREIYRERKSAAFSERRSGKGLSYARRFFFRGG